MRNRKRGRDKSCGWQEREIESVEKIKQEIDMETYEGGEIK